MNSCHPPDHSHFLVLGAVKGACAGGELGDAGGHNFYSVWLILCSSEGWVRRRPGMIQKRGLLLQHANKIKKKKVVVVSAKAGKVF